MYRTEYPRLRKNIVVTGGGTEIGNAIAISFTQAGSKSISIVGRRPDKLQAGAEMISAAASERTNEVLFEVADLLERAQVDQAFQSIVSKVGKVDVLVANAGMLPAPGSLKDYSAEAFIHGIEGNVLTMNSFQAFLPLAGSDPIILSTSTCLANITSIPGISGYAVSKAACLKMMDYLAVENPHLHVVSVQLGWVATDMNGHQKEAPIQVR
jgi:NAD(P)-dependent dehydrogenase (short-subunit alcohol dehydrogenase family)